MLAVIPARSGSKGLPGKNIRELAGLPLLAHSLRCAALAPVIDRCVVSTDGDEIAEVARRHGGDVPFRRPAELASDTAAMMPVLQHALAEVERQEGRAYETLLLLDPTSPGRLPDEIARAAALLDDDASAVGVVACSRPTFNPFWVGVVERPDQRLGYAFDAARYERRQDVPPFYRINGSLYLWRTSFLRALAPGQNWLDAGPHRLLEMPEARAFSIDDAHEFAVAQALLGQRLITLPWLPEAP